MHTFYFNECIDSSVSMGEFNRLLSSTLREFDTLTRKAELQIDSNIVLEKEASGMQFNIFTLKDAILALDREVKIKALSIFSKAPIGDYFECNDDYLLESDHKFEGISAINLAMVANNNGVLFTLPTSNSLRKDQLDLASHLPDRNLSVRNLYGEPSNTNYIAQSIIAINKSKLTNYEKLGLVLGNFKASKFFDQDFMSAPNNVQQSIINGFEKARERNLPTPFCPGLGMIKDVSPDENKKESKIYELRIFSPLALRVYFYVEESTVLLAQISYKADSNEYNNSQGRDIKKAHAIIESLYKQTV